LQRRTHKDKQHKQKGELTEIRENNTKHNITSFITQSSIAKNSRLDIWIV